VTEREIFFEALEMATPEARAAYLHEACKRDVSLRRKVDELLKEHFSNDSLLSGPAVEGERATFKLEFAQGAAPAQMIGRYKLLEKLGEGGFGEVWMAEQREPVKRRVALKIIKLGMDSRQIVARFEAERQALAMMDHANIAKIFDAGTTDSGRPYFVMELVRGIKITEYCDQNQLPTRERLNLFILVCQAIQHAHQKGIIHRDIKPSNILVTLHDGVPVPKVIDFGIAKATQGELTDKTVFTQFQQFIGTPAYISPEQAEMSGLDIDTRADIYSLGVLLYELLVGQTPFDAKEMMKGGLDALRQIIREKEPLPPSTKLNTLEGDARTTAGKRRQTEVGKLVHQLQGDLDWIVMKCLEKDRTRRYETASGLAIDVQRHLDNEPVVARPPSRLYEFQKTVKRHKIGFAAAGGVIMALAIGLGIATWTLVKEERGRERADNAEQEQKRQRQIAESKEKQSQEVAEFLKDMLKGVGPSVALGSDTKLLRQILDQTAERVEKSLASQPEVEAELRGTLGNVYADLGEYTNAIVMLEQALRLRTTLHPGDQAQTAKSLNDLAQALFWQGSYSRAEAMHREALAMRRRLFGAEDAAVVESLNNLGETLRRQAKLAQAEEVLREALNMRRKLPGEHLDLARTLQSLGLVLWKDGRFPEAEAAHREALTIRRKLLGDEHPDVADSLSCLGLVLRSLQKYPEAEASFREVLAMQQKVFGNEHPMVANSLQNVALALSGLGRKMEAEQLLNESLTMRRKLLGSEHPDVAITLAGLGDLLGTTERLSEAEAMYREAWSIWRKLLGDANPETARSLKKLVTLLQAQHKDTELAALYHEDLQIQRTLGDPLNIAKSLFRLAALLRSQGKLAETEIACKEALASQRERLPSSDPKLLPVLFELAKTLRAQGKRDEAESLYREGLALAGVQSNRLEITTSDVLHSLGNKCHDRGELLVAESLYREALEIRKTLLSPAHPSVGNSLERLGTVLTEQNRFAEAELVYGEAVAVRRQVFGNEHPSLAVVLSEFGTTLRVQGKFEPAESAYRESLAIRQKKIPDEWYTFYTRCVLGETLLAQKKFDEAEPLLLQAYKGLKQQEGTIPIAESKKVMKKASDLLTRFYKETGRTNPIRE
jgi:serine/threonine protein kinase/tetratricopeptide (TPR) repeat protein